MKVLLVNGSPHPKGGTFKALSLVERSLNENGVETEWLWIGNKLVRGCINCKGCMNTYRCRFDDDPCNKLIEAILAADGVVIGTPVYFAAPNGALCALLDRVFYAAQEFGHLFGGKPAAAVASLMRSGSNSAIDRLNKYFTFSEMPVVSSSYWNMLFEGNDKMGENTMLTLGKRMADMLLRNHVE